MSSRARKILWYAVWGATSLYGVTADGQTRVRLEGGTFLPFNVPMSLSVYQSGEPALRLTAHYASEPFAIPICWVWRVSLWSGNRGWELEAVHHKIFLENPPPEIGKFQISHGVNLVTVNRAWQCEHFVLRAGAGVALAHPENTIRGKILPEDGGIFGWGYYLAGPAVGGAVGRHFPLGAGFLLTAEVKLSGYYASVPVVDGRAHVWGLLAQLSIMVGWQNGGS
jgi:hypothetical protein